jgi:hypothetical protein
MKKEDYTLEVLLDLDGFIAEIGRGYWVKFEAKKIKAPSINKPYGIKYSLTLHSPDGDRILGYDNAHQIQGVDFTKPYDHRHKQARIMQYNYQNAEQLLTDFWQDVDKFLNKWRH